MIQIHLISVLISLVGLGSCDYPDQQDMVVVFDQTYNAERLADLKYELDSKGISIQYDTVRYDTTGVLTGIKFSVDFGEVGAGGAGGRVGLNYGPGFARYYYCPHHLFAFFGNSVNRNSNCDVIKWADSKLNWENFEEVEFTDSKFVASCYSGIYTKIVSGSSGQVKCFVSYGYFNSISWVLKGQENERLLNHEQLHFDITELVSRQIKKSIAEETFSGDVKSKITHSVELGTAIRDSLQSAYDKQTRHGESGFFQAYWNYLIREQLDSLKKYENDYVQVTIVN